MADVLAADLVRLAPSERAAIEKNLASLKTRVAQLKSAADNELGAAPSLIVAALSPHFS
jgi:ABC-type Zn uptake system ZnuABC Zn-binding protein ZnuA